MKQKYKNSIGMFTLAFLTIPATWSTCWAAPPGPPTTPVGGTGLTIATAVAIAGYGYWKNRK